jgi:ankyrin repeat protein
VGHTADPNIRVAAKHKIVISAVREELAVAVVNALLDAYPKAVRVDSEGGRLPLHTACAGRATPRVVQTLVRADPAAARHRNKDGFLPLHLAAHWGVSHPNVAVTLLQSYPDATVGRNRWERTPLEEALCMAGENGRAHQAALVRALRKHPSYWSRPTADYLGSPRKSSRKNSSKCSAHEPIDMDESLPSNDDTMDTPEEYVPILNLEEPPNVGLCDCRSDDSCAALLLFPSQIDRRV